MRSKCWSGTLLTNDWLQTSDYKRLLENDCLRTLEYKRLITNAWLQAIVYKRVFTNDCLQTIVYKPLFTNDCLQTIVYKRLFTNGCFETIGYKRLSPNDWLQTSGYKVMTNPKLVSVREFRSHLAAHGAVPFARGLITATTLQFGPRGLESILFGFLELEARRGGETGLLAERGSA